MAADTEAPAEAPAEAVDEVEVLPPAPEVAPAPGEAELVMFEDGTKGELVPSRNYAEAVELGKVMAASKLYGSRDAAKCAVQVMYGLDLGISPTAAMGAIHIIETDGRLLPVIEGKVLAGLIKARAGYDYDVVTYTDELVEIVFKRHNGKQWRKLTPVIKWDEADSMRANLSHKKNHKTYPRTMKLWRCLAEGTRLHFPELLMGSPIYVHDEFSLDGEDVGLMDKLTDAGPRKLDTPEAEELRERAEGVYNELCEVNPRRLIAGRYASMLRGAGHSIAELGATVRALEDLRDTERELQDLLSTFRETEGVSESEVNALTERIENRCSDNRERIEVVADALRHVVPTATDADAAEVAGDDEGAA